MGQPRSRRRSARARRFSLLAIGVIACGAIVSCRGAAFPGKRNVVLVTVESLRFDRISPPAGTPDRDPLVTIRQLASRGRIYRAVAPSSDTVPALASILTGAGVESHGLLVEGIDRLSPRIETVVSRLRAAGWLTAGFPTLGGLGLASGLDRGFDAYALPEGDHPGGIPLLETSSEGWVGARRQGGAALQDLLAWIGRRGRSRPFFAWVHLSEAAAPYAATPELGRKFGGSGYNAAIAYDDQCVKLLLEGLATLGVAPRTTIVVAGDHGESLGAHGEQLHGLNLYEPSLLTLAVVGPAAGPAGGAKEAAGAAASTAPDRLPEIRLADLAGILLAEAGVVGAPPAASTAHDAAHPGTVSAPVSAGGNKAGAPAALLAATLVPRIVYGWEGRIALRDGGWKWIGPLDEELYDLRTDPLETTNLAAQDPERARRMREKALAAAGALTARCTPGGSARRLPAEERVRSLTSLRNAVDAQAAGQDAEAIRVLDEIFANDPTNLEAYRFRAGLGWPKNASAEFEALIRKVVTLPVDPIAAHRAAAAMRDMAGDRPGVRNETAETCRAAGDAAGCRVALALEDARIERTEDAIQELEALLKVLPDDTTLRRTLGDLQLAKGDAHAAAQAYGKAAETRPEDTDLVLRLGDALMAVKDWDAAAARYRQALALSGGHPTLEVRLGDAALGKGETARAIDHYRRGVEGPAGAPATRIAFGRVLLSRGLAEPALAEFLGAAAADPHSGEALYYAGSAAVGAGKTADAETYFRQALDRDPGQPVTIYQLARLALGKGDTAEAVRRIRSMAGHADANLIFRILGDPVMNKAAANPEVEAALKALRDTPPVQTGPGGARPGAPAAAAPSPASR